MKELRPQAERLIWVGLGLTLALVLLAFLLAILRYQASRARPLPVYGQVSSFTLTNQSGKPVTFDELRGHTWIADIIFTRCAGPCLKMTRQMKELQDRLPEGSTAKLVTLTTDADFDTPPVLKTYAERFKADTNRWMFLTGSRRQIADLAAGSLKLTAIEKPLAEQQSPNDLFVHSTIFVLVDKSGQLRGIYETAGEGTDWEQTRPQILAAVRKLERDQ
jgi:protein SCO1